jgi:esterase/lipase superfamily enzyme
VPRDHRIGELEGPSIFRLEFRDDPERHIVVLQVRTGNAGEFNRVLADRLASSLRHEALLFVHGFNVTFEDALRRAAQISYDLAFDGPTVVFSWPSQGRLLPLDYRRDERNAELSADNLRQVIVDLFARHPNTTVHAIAHSMGNRVLSSALQQIAADATVTARLQEVAMVAPDIDAELFRKAAGRIAGAAKRVTLYASSADAALKASQNFAGYPRAGQGGNNLVVVRGVDTVDASSVDTSILGLNHSYYADNTTFLSDLFHLLRGRPPAERFGLVSSTSTSGPYWLFRP